MTGWAWDLLQTWRRLRRTAGFTAAAVATLGVAVAACAVALAFGWAAVLQPVSLFPHRDRLVDIQSTRGKGPDDRFGVAPADFVAWKAAQTSFEAFGAYVPIGEVDLTGGGGAAEPLQLHAHLATADVFRALGVPPALGRVFAAADEEAGNDRVALLSDALWRRLGADPGLVGGTLRLNGEPHWVVGVMPPGFGLRGNVPDLWLPLAFGPRRPADRRTGTLVVLGRLRPGVDLARAGAELDAIGAALATEFADTNRDLRPSLRPLVPLLSETVRPTVRLLLGAVAVPAPGHPVAGRLLPARARAGGGGAVHAVRGGDGAAAPGGGDPRRPRRRSRGDRAPVRAPCGRHGGGRRRPRADACDRRGRPPAGTALRGGAARSAGARVRRSRAGAGDGRRDRRAGAAVAARRPREALAEG